MQTMFGLLRRYSSAFLWLSSLGLLTWLAARQCRVDLWLLWTGLPAGLARLKPFLHPEWSALPTMLWQAGITVAIALLATPVAAALSLVIGFAAARNTAWSWVRVLARFSLVLERVLPDIFVLILLVAALGLGPVPAVIALVFASLGMLGKLFADAIEEVDERALEAIRVTGAGYGQVLHYGVLPRITPSLISHSIFRFELNIRSATILGAVAGQGIGFELYRSIGLLEYGRASMAVIIIMVLVHLAERLSAFGRSRLLQGGKLK